MLEKLEKAERLNTVTQQVGFAVWQLQELERCSAIYFVLLAQATRGIGSDAGEALVKKAQSKTFGATIKELVKANLLTQELAAEFARLLEERNWLVHRSRADCRGAIHGDGTVQQLLRRIDAISDNALVLLKKIDSLTARFMSAQGIPQKYIDQESRRLQKEWAAHD